MEIATLHFSFIPMRYPPNCALDHKHEYQPLSGPSRSSHNGRHHTAVAPYPKSQITHGSLGMILRNPPVGTHLSANNHHPSGGIQGTPLGFAPRIQPPKPIRTFIQNWREPKRPPPTRDDPQLYEIPFGMLTAQFIACRSIH